MDLLVDLGYGCTRDFLLGICRIFVSSTLLCVIYLAITCVFFDRTSLKLRENVPRPMS